MVIVHNKNATSCSSPNRSISAFLHPTYMHKRHSDRRRERERKREREMSLIQTSSRTIRISNSQTVMGWSHRVSLFTTTKGRQCVLHHLQTPQNQPSSVYSLCECLFGMMKVHFKRRSEVQRTTTQGNYKVVVDHRFRFWCHACHQDCVGYYCHSFPVPVVHTNHFLFGRHHHSRWTKWYWWYPRCRSLFTQSNG